MEMCTLQDTMCHGILIMKQNAQNVAQKLVSQLKGSSIYTKLYTGDFIYKD